MKQSHKNTSKVLNRNQFFNVFAGVFILGVVFLLYSQSLHYPFFFDSKSLLKESFFKSGFQFSLLEKRWVTNFSFYLTNLIFGLNVYGQRLANLVIHAGNAILIFAFLNTLFKSIGFQNKSQKQLNTRWFAFFAGLVFAVNPVAVYATAYTIQRYILLATFFSLLSLVFYLKGLTNYQSKSKPLKDIFFYLISVLCYYLAVYSKEHAVMLPFMALILTFLVGKIDKSLCYKLVFPALLFTAIGLQITLSSKGVLGTIYEPHARLAMNIKTNISTAGSIPEGNSYILSVITQGYLYFKYIFLWFIPIAKWMSIDIQLFKISSIFTWPQTLVFFIFCIYPLFFMRLVFKKGLKGLLGFSALFPWFLFLTELSTVRFSEQFVLYRSYLWMPGFLAVFPFLFQKFSKIVSMSILILFCILLAFVMQKRLATFRSTVSVWQDAVDKIDPLNKKIITSYRTFNSLGYALIEDKKYKKALDVLKIAVKQKPNYDVANYNLGVAYESLNNLDLAVKYYKQTIKFNPAYPKAYNSLGAILFRQGKTNDSIKYFETALKINPSFVNAYNNIGAALVDLKNFKDAIKYYEMALKIDAQFKGAHNNLAIAYSKLRKFDLAVKHYQKALELDPEYIDGYFNFADFLYRRGEYSKSIKQYQIIVEKNKSSSKAHYSLGNAYAKLGNIDRAIQEYQESIKSNPDFAKVYFNLGVLLAKKDQIDEAILKFKKALTLEPGNTLIQQALDIYSDE